MLYVTGDTHGMEQDTNKLWKRPFSQISKNLTKDDVVIIAGDFGWCFNATPTGAESSEERKALDHLEKLPFTTLFIDGNHENFDRLLRYREGEAYSGKVGILRNHVLHLKQRGHIYDICGYKVWCFGGASSTDKQYRTEGRSWWPQEEAAEAEYAYGLEQLKAAGWKVDLVVAHEAPELLSNVILAGVSPLGKLPIYLQDVVGKLSFSRWYFAHYHGDMDFEACGKKFGDSNPKRFSELYQQITAAPSGVAGGNQTRRYCDLNGSSVWSSMDIAMHGAEKL